MNIITEVNEYMFFILMTNKDALSRTVNKIDYYLISYLIFTDINVSISFIKLVVAYI